MKYALICIDKADSLSIRLETRDRHVAHLKASELVEQAGPFLDASGDMCGSLIILEADDISQVQEFANGDPYKNAGLFESVTIKPWNRVISK